MSKKAYKEFTVEAPDGKKIPMKFYYDPEKMTNEQAEALKKDVAANPRDFWAVQANQGREFDHPLSYNNKYYHIGQGGNKYSFEVTPK